MARMIYAVGVAFGHLAFGLPAAAVDVAPWCAVIKGGEYWDSSIALWKIAILMSWEALAAGVIRIGISSQRRQNPKVQRVVALDERRVAFCCASWSAGGFRCRLSLVGQPP
jgi:hypothetical protein